jgi:predicted CXXCH cytochrome family protein
MQFVFSRAFFRLSLIPVLGMAFLFGVKDLWGDIRETKHNLLSAEQKKLAQGERDQRVCVVCHTPSSEEELPAVPGANPEGAVLPLWNATTAPQEFTIYDDIGKGESAIGSQSVACLSCHDGIQAFGVTDKSYDHPFGVPYRGSRARAGLSRDYYPADGQPAKVARFMPEDRDFRPASAGTIKGRDIWWVSRGGITPFRNKSDLPLYGRVDSSHDGGQSGNKVPFVECSSCHDPHTENNLFLRVSNRGSALCLTCHDK